MTPPSRTRFSFGRRDVLRLLVAAPTAGALTTACASGSSDGPDPLQALARSARADAALAQAIAQAHSPLADSAKVVASARTQHADALQREVDRVDPPAQNAPPRSPHSAKQAPASAAAAKSALSQAVRSGQDGAAALVPTLPPYRAGLLGSVSASCASLSEVLT